MRRCSRLWGSFPASGKFGEASTALASRDKFAVCMSAGGKGIRVSEFRSQRSAESTKADRSRSDMRSLERLHSTRKPCIIGQQQGPGRVASPEAARQHSKISTRGFFNSLPRPDETASRAIPNTGRGGQAGPRNSSHPGNMLARHSLPTHGFFTCDSQAARRRGQPFAFPCSLPRNRSVATAAVAPQSEAEAAAGCLVEFRKDKDRMGLALIEEPDGKKNWHARDVRGIRHSLRPQQIVYVLPGKEYTTEDMQAIHQSAGESASDTSLMEAAWEVVSEDGEEFYSVAQMADLLFNEGTPAACYAAHRLLNEDRTYFKQVGRAPPMFQARPEREVVNLRQQAEALRKAEEEKAQRIAALQAAIAMPHGEKPGMAEWLAGPWAATVRALQDFALVEHEPNSVPHPPREVLEVTGPLGGGAATPRAAALLLKRIGAWAPHQHLAPLKAGLTDVFPADVLAQAEEMLRQAVPDVDESSRVDLTRLAAWAVDSAETTEVDDAVSCEDGPEGRKRFWVHIADPTRWLQPGSPMDEEAARRTTSMYLPTGSVSMFPRHIAEQLFSLVPGQPDCALSVWVELDAEGGIAGCGATPSTVRPERMTYSELDRRLEAPGEGESDLSAMLQAAQLRQGWRVKHGAIQLSMPECDMRIIQPNSLVPDISMRFSDGGEDSPAQTLVSELMIMANEAIGLLGEKAGLPLPYRGQAAVVMPSAEDLAALPEGPCRKVAIRNRMTRSVTTTGAPLRHAGLGLERYVQATSPIRRYADLLTHWQLKAQLRGEQAPYSADTLSQVVESLQTRGRTCMLVEREVSRYWQIEFFSRQLSTEPMLVHDALLLTWVREESGFAKGLLLEFGLEIELRVNRPAALGETLRVRCVRADVSTNELRFEEAAAPAPVEELETAGESDDSDGSGLEVEAEEDEASFEKEPVV